MAYQKQEWRNKSVGGTPIVAERLNHMEEGISQNAIDLAAVKAIVGYSPDRYQVFETGIRDITASTPIDGQKTDSGHTWQVIAGSEGSDQGLVYQTSGHIYGGGGKASIPTQGLSIVSDWNPASIVREVGATWWARGASHWDRWLVVSFIDVNNWLAVVVSSYNVYFHACIAGTPYSLASWGNLNNGSKGHHSRTQIHAMLRDAHANYSPVNLVAEVYLNGDQIIQVPLTSQEQPLIDTPGTVGFRSQNYTEIYSLYAGESLS